MFDIGFSELLLVMVIGLVVLGPERLPVAVKTVVGWIRTLRSLASTVQNELSQELKLQELQDSLKKVEKASLQNLSPELKASMDELKEAAEAMKRGYAEKSPSGEGDAQEPLSYQPLNDPEAVHDGVIDTEKRRRRPWPINSPRARGWQLRAPTTKSNLNRRLRFLPINQVTIVSLWPLKIPNR